MVYDIAHRLHIPTYGIVSEKAKNMTLVCEHVFFVPDPHGTWEVKSPEGWSYMVDVAQPRGQLFYFGGGLVSLAEIQEATQRQIPVTMDPSFDPDPVQAALKRTKNPKCDVTPVRTWLQHQG